MPIINNKIPPNPIACRPACSKGVSPVKVLSSVPMWGTPFT